MHSYTFEAIGTHWVIDIDDSLSEAQFTEVKEAVMQRISSFDKTFSRFRTDSLIHTMANQAGSYPLPAEGIAMLHLYQKLYDITGGLVTPLIGSVMEEAGYDRTYSLQAKTLHNPPPWEDVLSLEGDILVVKKPALLDLGALGKGALIDLVSQLLDEQGCISYCVDAGGDMFYKNETKALRVGLEHPEKTEQVLGVVTLRNQSIAGSAGNRRSWGAFHHIINPKTLKPVEAIKACWVISDTAMVADGLATALFFVSPDILSNYFKFSYLIVYPDYTTEKSDAFPGELYYTE